MLKEISNLKQLLQAIYKWKIIQNIIFVRHTAEFSKEHLNI